MKLEQEARSPVVELGAAEHQPRPEPLTLPPPRREEPLHITDHLFTILQGRWIVLGVTLFFLLVGLVYVFVAVPIYRTNVLLQVEENRKSLAGIEEISQALGERAPPGETEMEILRSRTLVGGVVDALALDVAASPHTFPLIGRAIARRYTGSGPAPAPLHSSFLGQYAWGGEVIRVGRIDVSDDLLGVRLDLVALPGGRFRVTDPDGLIDLTGKVGTAAVARSGARRLELFVVELTARPGTRFDVARNSRGEVIQGLQRALQIEERGKKTGILAVSLDGADPERIAAILDSFSNNYVRQNVERKSLETAKTLEFLEAQLPVLKSNLEQAQASLNSFQVRKGTVDLNAETQSVLQRSVEVERQISELELQRSELRQRFTDSHPAVTALKDKIEQLQATRAALATRMRGLPETEGDSVRHQRDVRVANELYALLLNKAQELKVVKSGTVGNVRILDKALVPRKPVKPLSSAALALSGLVGLSFGVAGAFARKALSRGVEDPEEIEQESGLSVFAMVPRSERQMRQQAPGRGAGGAPILAAEDPGDVAVENLRSLRTSLQFALVEARNNVIAVSGPGPGVGKSFVSMNLAHVLASTERRILLVDGDLRRGQLHHAFGEQRGPGLSDLVSGGADVEGAIRSTIYPGLDLLPTGRVPPNPAELLASHRFERLLADLSRRYDLVIVDTPPVLAVTDASLVGRLAGVNLLVLRSGTHPMREINLTVKRLAQSGIRVQGAVLNDVRSDHGRFGRYGRYQRYEYRSLAD